MPTTAPGSHDHIVVDRGAQQNLVGDDHESQLSHTRPRDVPGCGQALADARGRKPWSGAVSRGNRRRAWTPLDPLFHLAKVEQACPGQVCASRHQLAPPVRPIVLDARTRGQRDVPDTLHTPDPEFVWDHVPAH